MTDVPGHWHSPDFAPRHWGGSPVITQILVGNRQERGVHFTIGSKPANSIWALRTEDALILDLDTVLGNTRFPSSKRRFCEIPMPPTWHARLSDDTAGVVFAPPHIPHKTPFQETYFGLRVMGRRHGQYPHGYARIGSAETKRFWGADGKPLPPHLSWRGVEARAHIPLDQLNLPHNWHVELLSHAPSAPSHSKASPLKRTASRPAP
jgi:hypothetical protein